MDSAARHSTHGLSAAAASFEFAVVWATVAWVVAVGTPAHPTREDWITFAILVPLVAFVHQLAREREKHQGSALSLAPMFTAALILPPLLAAGVIAAAFIPEWIRTRLPWYIVLFNVANFVGPALVARGVFDAIAVSGPASWTLAALAGVATFLLLQYGVLAVMLKLARGVSIRDTVRIDCVLIDAGLLSLGALGAALADWHPSLLALLALPLALAYRSLEIPSLVEASRIEPKTGLYNMRHLNTVLETELQRAGRFDYPISLLMIDVDHLRQINGTFGHMVGDRALQLVAQTVRDATREYDIAARFGGDEFCVLLPHTPADGALVVAERIRAGVEVGGKERDLELTVSIGAVTVARAGVTPEELITLADRAAYRAKFSGRNAVATAPEGDPVDEAERLLAEASGGEL
jgi:diguanylate cyclase (GGDEF)-like protein